MKILKKLSALIICVLLLTASACETSENTASNMFASQYWLSNTESDVGSINETSLYTISFVEKDDNESETKLQSTLSGTLTTNIQTSSYEGQACYKFTTSLTATGTYTYGDKSAEINDQITSTVYFLGISTKFFPLYSEKTVNVTSPIKNSSVEFIPVAYSVTTKYDKSANSATVKVVSNLPEDAKYKIADSERVYEKITKGAPYLDNESLIFIPRASDLKEGFSASFRTIDALSQKVHNMNLAVSSTSATVEIKLDSYTVDGVPVNPTFNCYSANISISGTFSGTAIKAYYSADAKTHGKRLVKMENELAYSLGKIVYTLQSVTNA